MTRYAMVIDLSECVGCNACAVGCKLENDVPQGKFNTWVESWGARTPAGDVTRAQLPKLCNHCSDPVCVSVCPTGASHKDEDGIVSVDDDRCIGCKYCMNACPYGVRWVDDEAGDVHKCTFCSHRTRYGLEPACVATCVTGARMFGDLDDPSSPVSKRLAAADDVRVLLDDVGLNPNVYYIGLGDLQDSTRASGIQKGGDTLVKYEND